MKYILLVVIFLVTISTVSWSAAKETENEDVLYQDFMPFVRQPEEGLFLLRCLWNDLDSNIAQSEFCIIGKQIITKDEEDLSEAVSDKKEPSAPNQWEIYSTWGPITYHVEGKVMVQSIIYGSPETEELPFSYTGDSLRVTTWFFDLPGKVNGNKGVIVKERTCIISAGSINQFSTGEPICLILGKGKAQNSTILRALWVSDEIISPQAIKVIKEFEGLSPSKFQKQQERLLLKSNNQELLTYLFRRALRESNMFDVIRMIKTISDEGLDTPERRFLAYGFALFMLYEFTDELGPLYEHTAKLTDTQREVLIEIATRKFSQISGSKQGIKYLLLTNMFPYGTCWSSSGCPAQCDSLPDFRRDARLFEVAPSLKDNIQKIIPTLSGQFKDDKDFPEWQKWVNKIFSVEIPLGPDANPPDNKGK
ncbi:MAG: hypothetical protein HY762_01285 [Planctomycetes bacterium]|nr:hypothetical protein [Planctomycetota bacterium]